MNQTPDVRSHGSSKELRLQAQLADRGLTAHAQPGLVLESRLLVQFGFGSYVVAMERQPKAVSSLLACLSPAGGSGCRDAVTSDTECVHQATQDACRALMVRFSKCPSRTRRG